jgi:DNA-binding PadR family transcriptional regulator
MEAFLSVRLFVLGALLEGEAHGYDLIEKGRSWGLESWSDISFSSIYHSLRAMTREGLLREVGKEREMGRPQRTVYRITPRGKVAFAALMEENAANIVGAKDPLYLALGFMSRIPKPERARMLALRIERLAEQEQGVRMKLEYLEGHPGGDYWALAAVRLNLRRIEAEIEWLSGLEMG